jgi:hypothetical protein
MNDKFMFQILGLSLKHSKLEIRITSLLDGCLTTIKLLSTVRQQNLSTFSQNSCFLQS